MHIKKKTYYINYIYSSFLYTVYIFIATRFLIDEAIPVPQLNILGTSLQPSELPRNGWTPLMWAAIVGNSQVTDLLIQATCDIFAKDVTWQLEDVGKKSLMIHP